MFFIIYSGGREKMESQVPQLLWGLNTVLLIVLGFMIKSWVNGITKKLSCKQDKSVCSERHPVLSSNIEGLFRHKHPIHEGKDMTGGVIIP